jgi:hypothetical protein
MMSINCIVVWVSFSFGRASNLGLVGPPSGPTEMSFSDIAVLSTSECVAKKLIGARYPVLGKLKGRNVASKSEVASLIILTDEN